MLFSEVHGQFIISGTVQEAESGEVIVGATISVMHFNRGAVSNRYGYFAIADLDTGKFVLKCSAVGYRIDTIVVHLPANQPALRLLFELQPQPIGMEGITIEAERSMTNNSQVSAIEIPMDQILRLPSLGGEVDLFRALQLLPGVKASSEISSGLYIRGGSPDQNLVLLDRMILYNPSHLTGFLSTFNSDALNNATLIKGAMNAEYGGRLSSVIDVTMREGDKEDFRGRGGLSMIDARLTLEGPLSDDATFMISGRRVYLDWLVNLFSDQAPRYYFFDFVAKTNVRFGENDRVYFSGFFGRDVMSEPTNEQEAYSILWGNSAGNLRWTHLFGPALFMNISAIVSDYRFRTDIEESGSSTVSEHFKSNSGISDYDLRCELEYSASSNHFLKSGIEFVLHTFTSDASSNISEFEKFTPDLPTYRGTEISFFVQDDWRISDRVETNIGGRACYFDRGKYFRFEPRFSAFYTFDNGLVLKAAFVGANQFLHLVSRNDLSLPTDMWFPSNSTLKPAYSLQYVLGVSKDILGGEMHLSLESYYKSMHNILEFRDDAIFSLFAPIEEELTVGSGRAYGMELFLQRQQGDFTGWIGYALAWTDRTFPELNDGKTFPPRYDRRHDVSFVVNYRLGASWDITAVWVYGTGQAFTFPVAQYSVGSDFPSLYYSDRNGYRLPAYHRLDCNLSHSFKWFGWSWKASFNLYNAYNRMNPFSQRLRRNYNTTPTTWEIRQTTLFPFLPTIGLSFQF